VAFDKEEEVEAGRREEKFTQHDTNGSLIVSQGFRKPLQLILSFEVLTNRDFLGREHKLRRTSLQLLRPLQAVGMFRALRVG
jgi:hypothetical protein